MNLEASVATRVGFGGTVGFVLRGRRSIADGKSCFEADVSLRGQLTASAHVIFKDWTFALATFTSDRWPVVPKRCTQAGGGPSPPPPGGNPPPPPPPPPPNTNRIIVPGVSIGGVALGATKAQVQAKLGTPANKVPTNDVPNGEVWVYSNHPVPVAHVIFSADNAEIITTESAELRTDRGVGPGSSEAEVTAAYPDAQCAATTDTDFYQCNIHSDDGFEQTSWVWDTAADAAHESAFEVFIADNG